ncbi:protein FAM177B [Pelodytes ibericus]
MSDGDVILNELEDVANIRVPRRIIHFASGETMEEYSTDEEEEEEEEEEKIDFQSTDTTKMNWGTYLQFCLVRVATTAFFTCDFLGGKLATLFGLNVPKYQYAIDEYCRTQEESDTEEEYVPKTSHVHPPNEKHFLQIQSVEYGTLHDRTLPSEGPSPLQTEALASDTIPCDK